MKKSILIAALVSLGASGSVLADCAGKRMNSFVVTGANFTKASVRDAVGKMLYGTPFRVEVDSDVSKLVSATNVSGPLGGVLRRFAEQSGLQVRVDECQVRVTSKIAAASEFFVEVAKAPQLPVATPKAQSGLSGRFLSDDN